jgi:hypothetical protein
MFETLEDGFEKSRPLDPRFPIFLYGATAAESSILVILGLRGHGFAHLFSLVDWAAMFLLSLTWLVTSPRSAPITRRDFRVRYTILLLLLMAQDFPFIWR